MSFMLHRYFWSLDTFTDFAWQDLTQLSVLLVVLLVVEVCSAVKRAVAGALGSVVYIPHDQTAKTFSACTGCLPAAPAAWHKLSLSVLR